MKEMVYGNRKKPEVLYNGEYKGHKFAILNLGSHPTAYVENKMAITDYYDCRLDNVGVHGGFTYCDNGYWDEESKKTSWLGWDYALCNDYCYSDSPWDGKQWTTAEIYDEVKSVIEQIIAVEEYCDSSEYKEIRDMILAAENDYSEIQRACKKLYTAGYRKQSDTVREFVEKLKFLYAERQKEYTNWDGNKINAVTTEWLNVDIDELVKEYGVEVEE